MAKKKKDLDIKLDTDKVDVSIVRKDGKTNIDVDTPIANIEIEKEPENTRVEIVSKTKAGATVIKVLRAIKALK